MSAAAELQQKPTTDCDRVLEALPSDGGEIVADLLVTRTRLPWRRVWPALAALASAQRAAVRRDAYRAKLSWARRIA